MSLLTVRATGGSSACTARHLGVRGDTEPLLSQNLPFKQLERRYREAFPRLYENSFVVIDAVPESPTLI